MPSLTIGEVYKYCPFKATIFVETGTLAGDTVNQVKPYFDKIYSIELNDKYAIQARNRFKDDAHITILQGDSTNLLLPVCRLIDAPAFFWLDGHWSGGETGRGTKDVPLIEELKQIVEGCSKECIIAVDDVRLFGTKINEDWLDITVDSILNTVKDRLVSYKFYPSNLNPEDRMVLILKAQ